MKTSRKLLTRPVALPPSFDSFFSFPTHKTGYSGVATYTRKHGPCCVPLKAEEGLTGLLQPKPTLGREERVSPSSEAYPPPPLRLSSLSGVDGDPEEDDAEIDYKLLDSEGRSLTLDFGLFVLINTYCPNSDSSENRALFKKQYHALLSSRIHTLIHEEKREVILLGDLNACVGVIDHVEGELIVAKAQQEKALMNAEMGEVGGEGGGRAELEEDLFFAGEGRAARRWLRDYLIPDGADDGVQSKTRGGKGTAEMIDITRKFWPGRKGMYTCWNTKLSARSTNYGTRIDYILITPGLLPWIKHADTQPHIKGSDHCPVYVDFHDEITAEDGRKIRLEEVLGAKKPAGATMEKEGEEEELPPPRIAARFWEEFSGKQTSLQQFFGAGAKKKEKAGSSSGSATPAPIPTTAPPAATVPTPTPAPVPESDFFGTPTSSPTPTPAENFVEADTTEEGSSTTPTPTPTVLKASTSTPTSTLAKRKLTAPEPVASSSKKAKKVENDKKKGQQSIASFFGGKTSQPKGKSSSSSSKSTPSKGTKNGPAAKMDMEDEMVDVDMEADLDEDYKLALQLSQQQDGDDDDDGGTMSLPTSSQATKGKDSKSSKDAWTSLLAPTQAPRQADAQNVRSDHGLAHNADSFIDRPVPKHRQYPTSPLVILLLEMNVEKFTQTRTFKRRYPKWMIGKPLLFASSALASLGDAMFGYSQGAIAANQVQPSFIQRMYGGPLLTLQEVQRGETGVNPSLQAIVVACLNLTALLSSFFAAYVCDSLGRRMSVRVGAVIYFCASLIQIFMPNLATLIAGRCIQGLAVGMLSMTVPILQCEIAPGHGRGLFVSIEYFFLNSGYALSAWVGYGFFFAMPSEISWRGPYIVQAALAIILFVWTFYLPETPRWLVQHGYREEALQGLADLHGNGDPSDPHIVKQFVEIERTINVEKALGEVGWMELFKQYPRRSLVGITCQSFAQSNGINVILYYLPENLTRAGFSIQKSLLYAGACALVYCAGTLPTMVWIDKWGRRKFLLGGSLGLAAALAVVGALQFRVDGLPQGEARVPTANGFFAFVCIYLFIFGASWGPAPWLLGAEIFPVRARAKGMALSTSVNWTSNFLMAFLTPILFNAIHGGFWFILMGSCLTSFAVVWYMYPETSGKTLEELGEVFGDQETTSSPFKDAVQTVRLDGSGGPDGGAGEALLVSGDAVILEPRALLDVARALAPASEVTLAGSQKDKDKDGSSSLSKVGSREERASQVSKEV
ncbi:hypothetical protein EST38_g4701 [Candolleomyces aberdarensis]|uniref:Major facilitator superfamily (MFS) profile domain-containing protein n=1 Tax=Candolleomyces aberdarensis TaxID=2316362 RepID=A0A4Q2DLZ5_9AGAR|nr:hypothetical protein EST38_g4701 [Candolleomyces aberdarensis]